jgi:type II secretory pathway component GspD/PulD (secretin)
MMRRVLLVTAIGFLCELTMNVALATDPVEAEPKSKSPWAWIVPEVELQKLISEVAKETRLKFLVHQMSPRLVVVGEIGDAKMTYPVLLAILRNNQMAAIRKDGVVNVIPDHLARSFPLPVISKPDPSILADEWVTRVITLRRDDNGPFLVAALRPLMPLLAHLVWNAGEKKLLLADRYGNTQRLAQVIEEIERSADVDAKTQ